MGKCPTCRQLTRQEGKCYNTSCIDHPIGFQSISTTGGNIVAVCSRCGAMVADWRRSRSRDGWPNQIKHARWHRQARV